MIVAIIVTYNPDVSVVARQLDLIRPQVDHVIVVDNASGQRAFAELERLLDGLFYCSLLANTSNLGVAEALNQGIVIARDKSADFLLMLDQDSLPASGMVRNLFEVFHAKLLAGEKVAAVGPCYRDINGREASPFVRLKGLRLLRIPCAESEVVEVDHLITSGSLISVSVLSDVGDMESQLFIDFVDTEWCLRAISKGYRIYGVGAAKMQHNLGEGYVKFLGRLVPIHHPLRYFFIIRNGIWLLKSPSLSFQWKLMDAMRMVYIVIACSLFLGDRQGNLKMMWRGFRDGIKGRMGPFTKD